MERRRTFSREFKLEAVKLVTERGVAVAQAAKDLDVHDNPTRRYSTLGYLIPMCFSTGPSPSSFFIIL